ncbi:MAG: hypothetical protein JWM11_3916 [Planctomycetaceae bacterium]|nr:hypothetical protein [Planctomycetaceae bacterium]
MRRLRRVLLKSIVGPSPPRSFRQVGDRCGARVSLQRSMPVFINLADYQLTCGMPKDGAVRSAARRSRLTSRRRLFGRQSGPTVGDRHFRDHSLSYEDVSRTASIRFLAELKSIFSVSYRFPKLTLMSIQQPLGLALGCHSGNSNSKTRSIEKSRWRTSDGSRSQVVSNSPYPQRNCWSLTVPWMISGTRWVSTRWFRVSDDINAQGQLKTGLPG